MWPPLVKIYRCLTMQCIALKRPNEAGGVVEYAILLSQFHHRLNQSSSTPQAFPTTPGLLLLNLNRPQRDLCSNLSWCGHLWHRRTKFESIQPVGCSIWHWHDVDTVWQRDYSRLYDPIQWVSSYGQGIVIRQKRHEPDSFSAVTRICRRIFPCLRFQSNQVVLISNNFNVIIMEAQQDFSRNMLQLESHQWS